MVKTPLVFLLFLLSIHHALQAAGNDQAATDSSRTDTLSRKKSYLILTSEAASNSSFFGRTSIEPLPNTMGQIMLRHKSGLWLSASVLHVFNSPNTIDASDGSIGWDLEIKDSVDLSFSYSKFIFPDQSALVNSTTSNYADVFLGRQWRHFYTSAGAMTIFGGANDLFLALSVSRYWGFENVLKNKDLLEIEPMLMAVAGTQNFARTYTEENIIPSLPANNPGPPQGTGLPVSGSASDEDTGEVPGFNIIYAEIKVPVIYTIKAFSFEPAWRLSIPINVLPDDPSVTRSIFSLNVSYAFTLKKNRTAHNRAR